MTEPPKLLHEWLSTYDRLDPVDAENPMEALD
jgi:hypothetical protein